MSENTIRALKKEVLSSVYIVISLIASHVNTISYIIDDADLSSLSVYLRCTSDKIKDLNNQHTRARACRTSARHTRTALPTALRCRTTRGTTKAIAAALRSQPRAVACTNAGYSTATFWGTPDATILKLTSRLLLR